MIIKGPKNLLNLTDSEATRSFICYAKQFIDSLDEGKQYSYKLWLCEKYLKDNYNLKTNIFAAIREMLINTKLMLDGDLFRIVFPRTKLKSLNMTCDQLIRFLMYGNLEISGCDIWKYIAKYTFIHF